MIEYRIDRRSGVSTYLQIVQQTQQALRLGLLEPGDKLPTAREVVEATAVNPNTVLKAYRELEREGLVEARRGLGTFVRRTLGAAGEHSGLRSELAVWASRARAEGLEREDIAALMSAVLDEGSGPDESAALDEGSGLDESSGPAAAVGAEESEKGQAATGAGPRTRREKR